jgi:predicted dienelactone hydrolase
MKSLVALLASLLVIGCADSYDNKKPSPLPKETPGRYKSEGGEYPVGAIPNATLHDPQRNKDIELVIEYPSRGQGPFPVIVFSHGYGGSNKNYVGLTEYWAGHGYVCIKPSHADAGKLRDLVREQMQERREARREGRQPDRTLGEAVWDSQSVADWRDRVRDVTFILDSFHLLEERYPELDGRLDRSRIAVAGHSYGAFVAMLIAGVEPVRDGKPIQLADPRVKAIVAMSPQGVSATRGLTAESFRNVKIPAMFMTGSEDRGALASETPEWRRTAFDSAPADDKYFVLIHGANHFSFGGGFTLPTADDDSYDRMDAMTAQQRNDRAMPRSRGENRFIQERGVFDSIKIAATAFWDAYLKNAPAAHEYLDTNLTQRSGVTMVKK